MNWKLLHWKPQEEKNVQINEQRNHYHGDLCCMAVVSCIKCSPSRFVLMVSQPLALCCVSHTQYKQTNTHTMSQLICTNIVQIVVLFINIHYPVSLTTFLLLEVSVFALAPGYAFTFASVLLSPCFIIFSTRTMVEWKIEEFFLAMVVLEISWMRTTITNRICCVTCAADKFHIKSSYEGK